LKLFLDANVVFSAVHHEQGRAQTLLALARHRDCELLTSRHALDEAQRNLALKSHGFEQRLAAALDAILLVAEAPPLLLDWARAEGLPPKDAPVLAAAVHANADLFVTGDRRDFGPFLGKTVRGVNVVTIAQALQLVLSAADE
jgi:predicted nucleic acid-binding protein